MLIISLGVAFNRKGILILSLKRTHFPLIPVLIRFLTDFIQNIEETNANAAALATIKTVVFKCSNFLIDKFTIILKK